MRGSEPAGVPLEEPIRAVHDGVVVDVWVGQEGSAGEGQPTAQIYPPVEGCTWAQVHAARVADALTEALDGSDRDTQTPGAVIDIVDGTMRQLHQIGERAVGESRRRLDATMERSAALLGEIRTRRGPVR